MTEEKCPYGCIFWPGTDNLYGDCRAPWQKDCHLNVEAAKRKEKKDDQDRDKSS